MLPGRRLGSRLPLVAALLALAVPAGADATTTTPIPPEVSGGTLQTGGSFTLLGGAWSPAAELAVAPGAEVVWNGQFAQRPLTFDDGAPGVSSGIQAVRTLTVPGHLQFRVGDDAAGSVWVAGPMPKLHANQPAAPDPHVTLDAADTTILSFQHATATEYAFDVDNDGTIDSRSANPILSWRYPGEGTYTARVIVTDDSGFTGEATAAVVVTRDEIPPEPDRTAPGLDPAALVTVSRRSLRRGVRLVVGTPSEDVTATVRLTRGSTVVATGTATGSRLKPLAVSLKVTSAGSRLLRRSRPASVRLRIALRDTAGNSASVLRTLRLRAP